MAFKKKKISKKISLRTFLLKEFEEIQIGWHSAFILLLLLLWGRHNIRISVLGAAVVMWLAISAEMVINTVPILLVSTPESEGDFADIKWIIISNPATWFYWEEPISLQLIYWQRTNLIARQYSVLIIWTSPRLHLICHIYCHVKPEQMVHGMWRTAVQAVLWYVSYIEHVDIAMTTHLFF